MKRFVSLLLVAVMCICMLVSCMPNLKKYVVEYGSSPVAISDDEAQNEAYIDFLNKVNDFALKMNDSISEQNAGINNFCLSPVAIYMSLAVACESSNGETRQEILDALGITYEQLYAYTRYLYSAYNTEYTYIDNYDTEHISAHEELAVSIWLNSNYNYKISGVTALAKNYNCDVFSIPFHDGTANKIMGQYVEYKTHTIMGGDTNFKNDSSFALLSLFHLKEIWNAFGTNLAFTLEGYDFENTDGSVVTKQLLKSTYTGGVVKSTYYYDTFYVETEHGYKLHFMVPKYNYTVERVFTPNNIKRMLAINDYGFIDDENQQINYTRILFPQIDAYYNGNISDVLQEDFAIEALFDKEKCDFSNLLSGDAYCNSFVHKARMRLSAKGIEGDYIDLAQSTHKPIQLPNYEKVYHEFILDRSFGFVLTDSDGMILYMGEINSLR